MKKTNAYLIEYVMAQLGLPYWYGTFGQKGSKKLYDEKKKQYPKQYTAKDYPAQYGKRVHDCAGLIKGAYWSETPTSAPKYDAKTDYGATAMYNHCTKKGQIASFDKVDGRLVFKGNDKTKTHVGVYVGGYVIEAKGHAYGVVKTKFNAKSWQYWGQSNLFEEKAGEKPKEDPIPTPAPAPAPAPAKPKEDPVTNYKVIADRGLNIRKSASKESDKLGCMPLGSTFKVSKTVGSWAYGKGYDKKGNYLGTGYAFMEWLKKI